MIETARAVPRRVRNTATVSFVECSLGEMLWLTTLAVGMGRRVPEFLEISLSSALGVTM